MAIGAPREVEIPFTRLLLLAGRAFALLRTQREVIQGKYAGKQCDDEKPVHQLSFHAKWTDKKARDQAVAGGESCLAAGYHLWWSI